jgi:hypothetical protein
MGQAGVGPEMPGFRTLKRERRQPAPIRGDRQWSVLKFDVPKHVPEKCAVAALLFHHVGRGAVVHI